MVRLRRILPPSNIANALPLARTIHIYQNHEKHITIFGGEQWRPLLHVADAAEAYIKCLEAPIDKIRGEIFNVGFNNENYKIIDVGNIIKKHIPETKMIIDQNLADKRDYTVSFQKIETLFDYRPQHTIKEGVQEIKESIKKGYFKNYTDAKYSNYKFLKNGLYAES